MYDVYSALRDRKGLRDSDVMRGTGISKSTLSDWKAGRYEPKHDKLKKIADFLGVSVYLLETGDDSENPLESAVPRELEAIYAGLNDSDRETLMLVARALASRDCYDQDS